METAMEEAKKLSGEAATVLKPWLEEMEARLKTDEVMRRLLAHHLAEEL